MTRRKTVKPVEAAVKVEAPAKVVVEGFAANKAAAQIAKEARLHSKPSFVNFPTLFKYRVTVEQIEEPMEVLAARLQELWETTEPNHHHTEDFRRFARMFSRLGTSVVLSNETRGIRSARKV